MPEATGPLEEACPPDMLCGDAGVAASSGRSRNQPDRSRGSGRWVDSEHEPQPAVDANEKPASDPVATESITMKPAPTCEVQHAAMANRIARVALPYMISELWFSLV